MSSTDEYGTIKMINKDKGFGFIRRESQHDLFFHVSECANKEEFASMEVNSKVRFQVGPGKRGDEGREVLLVQ